MENLTNDWICKNCGKHFEEDWRKDRRERKINPVPNYCCRACANVRRHTEDIKIKIGNSVKMTFAKSHPATKKVKVLFAPTKKTIRVCANCGKTFTVSAKGRRAHFCSQSCKNEFYSNKKQDRFNQWLNGDLTDCIIQGISGGELKHVLRRQVKEYLLIKQNYCCAICGSLNVHNNKPLIFVLDHVDGNWQDNHKSNLRMICPNCNSQLETTKHNHGKGRFSSRYYAGQERDRLRDKVKKRKIRSELRNEDNLLFE
jgi:protein-arginine kinase activator protein McsA